MADSIPLPEIPNFREWPYSREQLRARDLEVAKVVLEAAAKLCRAIELDANRIKYSQHAEGRSDGAGECAALVGALRFHHE